MHAEEHSKQGRIVRLRQISQRLQEAHIGDLGALELAADGLDDEQ